MKKGVDTDPKKVEALLSRGVEEAINKEELRAALLSGRKLRVKLGIDPTSPNIHIGRAVVLRKLRAFQELGHQVVFIVGDFTGVVGDTSDKDAERPMLSEEAIKQNLKNYFAQAFKILDKRKTEKHYNSSWLKRLSFMEIGKLADVFSVHDFISRDLIRRRLEGGKRVSLREVLYPLMQGYDSVAVKADVELGGTDQKFNLLAGRAIQPAYGQEPQNILMTKILEGLDGRKMSSSWGNVINLSDSPDEMFGKTMSLRDDLIVQYLLLATDMPEEEIERIRKGMEEGTVNPRDAKMDLAHELVRLYHGLPSADEARERFVATFQNKEVPEDVPVLSVSSIGLIPDALKDRGIVGSKTDLKRLLSEGAVTHLETDEKVSSAEEFKEGTYRIGKKRFVKITFE